MKKINRAILSTATIISLLIFVPLAKVIEASPALGTVKAHQKISDTQGNFTGTLDDYEQFGSSVASIGDLEETG